MSTFQKSRLSTAEARDALMKASPTRVAVEVTDLETNITNKYVSVREAARIIGICRYAMGRRIRNESMSPYKGRYVIKPCSP